MILFRVLPYEPAAAAGDPGSPLFVPSGGNNLRCFAAIEFVIPPGWRNAKESQLRLGFVALGEPDLPGAIRGDQEANEYQPDQTNRRPSPPRP